MRKSVVLSLTLILVFTGMLAACTSQEQKDAGADNGSEETPEIHILLSHANADYAQQVKEDDRYIEELSKLTGFDLSFEFLGHGDDYIQQITTRFASGDLPDLIRSDSIDSTWHPGALENGVFADLTDLIDEYGPNLKEKIPEEAWESPRVSKDGRIYGIPAVNTLPATRVVYIRQDWLDKLGMDQPETLDDYLEFFEAVKQEDMNGNGDPNDEYGFYVRENLIYSDLFFKEFGAHPGTWMLKDGQLEPGMIQPEIKESLKFWKMLYENEYINPDLFTNKNEDWRAGIKQGKAGMWIHDITNYSDESANGWAPHTFVEDNVEISFLEPPVGPNGDQGLTARGDQMYFVWVVPEQNDKAEEVIKLLDRAWSEELDSFFTFGIEDHNYTVVDGEIQYDPKSPENTENGVSDFYQLSINLRGNGLSSPDLVEISPEAELIKDGMEKAERGIYENDGLHMPALESLQKHPELAVGTGAGTLFLDMFAKVITGKEDLEQAFDEFVEEWKRRGGDQAIEEATNWYNDFHGN